MAETLTITPSAVYRSSSDNNAWAAEDFRTGYASGNQWRSKLVLPIGNVSMGKSTRLVVGLSPYDYTVWPGTILAVLSDTELTPAQVLSADKVGSYRNGPHADLLATSIAQSVAYSDAAGTSAISYSTSMKKGSTFYFVFNTTALKANTTYYLYAMRNCTSSSYAGFTVIDDLSYITATLTYEKKSGSYVYYDNGGTDVKCEDYCNQNGTAVKCDVYYNNGGTAVKM